MRSLMFCDFLNPDAVRQPVTFMGDTRKYPSSFSQVIVTVIYLFGLLFSADWRRSLVSRSGIN